MKIICFVKKGEKRAGIVSDNRVIDISLTADILFGMKVPHDTTDFLKREDWFKIAGQVLKTAAKRETDGKCIYNFSDIRLCAPVPRPGKIICLGLNYHAHVKEQETPADVPEKPLLFSKAPTTITGPFDQIIYPELTNQLDYEIELGVVIGKRGKNIRQENAYEYIAGYTVFNDVSARDVQMNVSQWFRGKSFDTFGPMGPCLVTPDELGDESNLELTLKVNGKVMQQENTKNLIFKIPEIISDISAVMTLEPGDLIATGTPGGVGALRNPPQFLQIGDEIEADISGIGKIKNVITGKE